MVYVIPETFPLLPPKSMKSIQKLLPHVSKESFIKPPPPQQHDGVSDLFLPDGWRRGGGMRAGRHDLTVAKEHRGTV